MIVWIVLVWKHAGFLSALALITWCLWFIPIILPNLLRQKILSSANLCSWKHVSPPRTHIDMLLAIKRNHWKGRVTRFSSHLVGIWPNWETRKIPGRWPFFSFHSSFRALHAHLFAVCAVIWLLPLKFAEAAVTARWRDPKKSSEQRQNGPVTPSGRSFPTQVTTLSSGSSFNSSCRHSSLPSPPS